MKAAPCSWRTGMKVRCSEASSASLRSSVSSPGMPKTNSAPSFSRHSTKNSAAGRGPLFSSVRQVFGFVCGLHSSRTLKPSRGGAGSRSRRRRGRGSRARGPAAGGPPRGRPWRRCRCTGRGAAGRARGLRAAQRCCHGATQAGVGGDAAGEGDAAQALAGGAGERLVDELADDRGLVARGDVGAVRLDLGRVAAAEVVEQRGLEAAEAEVAAARDGAREARRRRRRRAAASPSSSLPPG